RKNLPKNHAKSIAERVLIMPRKKTLKYKNDPAINEFIQSMVKNPSKLKKNLSTSEVQAAQQQAKDDVAKLLSAVPNALSLPNIDYDIVHNQKIDCGLLHIAASLGLSF